MPYLRNARRLAVLDLAETNLSDRGLEQLRGLGALRLLYLGGTSVTQSGVESFQQNNPQCHVVSGKRKYYENSKTVPNTDED